MSRSGKHCGNLLISLVAKPVFVVALLAAGGCAHEGRDDPLAGFEEVDAVTIIDAPSPRPGTYAPADRERVLRGEYLVELLGCGACHTDGALRGEPDTERSLAGSQVGIAYTSPLDVRYPGIVYPPNITPDVQTGIGTWSDRQVAEAIRAGIGRHGSRRIAMMPWQGYAGLSNEDVGAIVAYLRSLEPVHHRVPADVSPGEIASKPFVYFGFYRSR